MSDKSHAAEAAGLKTSDIPAPTTPTAVRADQAPSGPLRPPIQIIRIFSPDEWEAFVQEWAQSLKSTYARVTRCSGAGDKGRDVVAYVDDDIASSDYDNYQCKHYDHALYPTDVWIELGKLIYYTFTKAYRRPRQYYFVCPHDVGTTLAKLFENSKQLKDKLIAAWDGNCKDKITKGHAIPLSGALLKHLKSYPFDTITFLPALDAIEQHSTTPWFAFRFGGGLPDRPKPPLAPDTVAANELPYTTELLAAYGEHLGITVSSAADISGHGDLNKHFQLSRKSFYSAEALQEFSRDHLPGEEYERLKDEIHDGIQEVYLEVHANGYHRVSKVGQAAVQLPITDHALSSVLTPADKRGSCHQLVNDGRLKWGSGNGS